LESLSYFIKLHPNKVWGYRPPFTEAKAEGLPLHVGIKTLIRFTPPHTLLFTAAMACSSSALESCIRLMAIVAPSGERSEKNHLPSGVELRS